MGRMGYKLIRASLRLYYTDYTDTGILRSARSDGVRSDVSLAKSMRIMEPIQKILYQRLLFMINEQDETASH